MLESIEVVNTIENVVGIGALPVRVAAAAWLGAPSVCTPILAGSASWARDSGDGDIVVGNVAENEIALDVWMVAG